MWLGQQCFALTHSLWFSLCNKPDGRVADLCAETEQGCNWDLCLRRELWSWEIFEIADLLSLLDPINLIDGKVSLVWKNGSKIVFSVRIFYWLLH